MPPTLSGPKTMIPICNYTSSSSSPRYALSSGNRLRVCRCSIESATNVPDKDCVVFYKECRSPLAWFRTSSTSSDKGFLISAKKREDDGGGTEPDKGLSEVKPTGFDSMQSSLDGIYNPQPPSYGNPDLLTIPGVGKKNLTKLVENDIADVDELKKIYKDKPHEYLQIGSTGSSSQTRVSKGKRLSFRRCYYELSALFSLSLSDKNPGRHYFGCRYFTDKKEDCGYFEWYGEEAFGWYKETLNDWKPNKKSSTQLHQIGNPSLLR